MIDNTFGTMISAYTRKQAIEDEVLFDLDAEGMGDVCAKYYACPIAVTSSVWGIIEGAKEFFGKYTAISFVGYLILRESKVAFKRVSHNTRLFQVMLPGSSEEITLKVVAGIDDGGNSCITVMMKDED